MNKSITMEDCFGSLGLYGLYQCKRTKTVPRTGKNETGNVRILGLRNRKLSLLATSKQTVPLPTPSSCLTEKTFPLGKALKADRPNGS